MELKVMTFNIQHCESFVSGEIDYNIMATAIKECGAEIIGLNEVRDEGEAADYEAQCKILSEKTGYYYYFAKAIDDNGNNPYGNAILSKYPILSAETIMIPDPCDKVYGNRYETRCILKANIDVCGGINVFVTHFGLYPDEAVNAVKAIIGCIIDEKTVLMGDFNVEPDNNILTPIKEAMQDTAVALKHNMLSWPADTPTKKIDYIFVSRDISVLEADIPEIIASDHRPCTAVLQIS